jgi:serine/threonine protein kinase
VNILLFGTDHKKTTWKICDFGSGTIKRVASSNDSIYTRKASTGDPIYSALEYVADGKVSRPKDIWSLVCIFLEVLFWILDDSEDVIKRFEEARKEYNIKESQDPDATYWSYEQVDTKTLPVLNAAVVQSLITLMVDAENLAHC